MDIPKRAMKAGLDDRYPFVTLRRNRNNDADWERLHKDLTDAIKLIEICGGKVVWSHR